jgi:hypothetical protein
MRASIRMNIIHLKIEYYRLTGLELAGKAVTLGQRVNKISNTF